MLIVLAALLAPLQDSTAVLQAVREGVTSGVYPGAVVVVGTSDRILLAGGVGHYTWSPGSRAPDPDSSLYDLASLTKVVATTSAAMVLVDRGALDLASPVRRYLPDFAGEGKEAVTVANLLEHRSGLRAFLRLDTLARTPDEARRVVLAEPLSWRPGTRVVYSDLNGMLLGWVVEAAGGLSLDAFVAREVFGPLGMAETRYRPARALRARIVPVGLWRGHPIAGELHDQNAARLGGVSGHAGLYSTGSDLARLAQFLLRRGRTADGRQLVRAETVARFTARGAGHRALGWEVRDTTERGAAGDLLSPAAFGHTGYTGTSMWLDPTRDVFVILLTNRVFAPRHRRSIRALREVRATVADAVAGWRDACRASGGASRGC